MLDKKHVVDVPENAIVKNVNFEALFTIKSKAA